MKYLNSRTGAVIDIKSNLKGGSWQVLEPAISSVKKTVSEQPQRKTGRKKNE